MSISGWPSVFILLFQPRETSSLQTSWLVMYADPQSKGHNRKFLNSPWDGQGLGCLVLRGRGQHIFQNKYQAEWSFSDPFFKVAEMTLVKTNKQLLTARQQPWPVFISINDLPTDSASLIFQRSCRKTLPSKSRWGETWRLHLGYYT